MKALNSTTLLSALAIGSFAFLAGAQAGPAANHAKATSALVRLAASEKKEAEGTKADLQEDKAEAMKKMDATEDKAASKVKHARHKVKHAAVKAL